MFSRYAVTPTPVSATTSSPSPSRGSSGGTLVSSQSSGTLVNMTSNRLPQRIASDTPAESFEKLQQLTKSLISRTRKSVEKKLATLGHRKRPQLNGHISPPSLSLAGKSTASEPFNSLQKIEIEEAHQQCLNAFQQLEENIKKHVEAPFVSPDDLKGIFDRPDKNILDTLHYTSPEGTAEFDIAYAHFVQRQIESRENLEMLFAAKKISSSPTLSNQSSLYLSTRSLQSIPENRIEPDTTPQSSARNSFVSIPESSSTYVTASNRMLEEVI